MCKPLDSSDDFTLCRAPLFVKYNREINLEALGFPSGITLFRNEIKSAEAVDSNGELRVRVYMKNSDAYITSIPILGQLNKTLEIVHEINDWCQSWELKRNE